MYRISELVKNESVDSWNMTTDLNKKVLFMKEWKAENELLASLASYSIEDINWDNQDQYVRHLVKTANLAMISGESEEVVGNFYQEAMEFYPWILYEEKHWMDLTNWQETPSDRLQIYADRVIGWQGDQIDWKVKEHVQMYQYLANEEIEQNDRKKAEKYLQAMKQVEDGEYWSKAQLGHFYLMQEKFNSAQEVYENCLAKSNDNHYECSVGLDLTKQQVASDEPYWRVSQEIFEDKNW
jgi:hypothetical protein